MSTQFVAIVSSGFKQENILNKVNLKVKSVEEDLEKQNEQLILTLEKVKSANADNSCAAKLRESLEAKSIEDDKRIGKLESKLVEARNHAEVSDRDYAEVREKHFYKSIFLNSFCLFLLQIVLQGAFFTGPPLFSIENGIGQRANQRLS